MVDDGPPREPPATPADLDRGPVSGGQTAGQGLIEYGLGLFMMAILILVILMLVGPRIGSIFSRLTLIG